MPIHKSDLAIENFGEEMSTVAHLTPPEIHEKMGYSVVRSTVGCRLYESIVCGELWKKEKSDQELVSRLFAERMALLLKETTPRASHKQTILAVGIGNRHLSPDALGPLVMDNLHVSPSEESADSPLLFAISTGTAAETGIDTARHIRALARDVTPDVILTVDSLSAKSIERLQTLIQLTNGGMRPGSALSHTCEEISSETMGCTVLSLGVPMVIKSREEDILSPFFVTRAETDVVLDCYARVLSRGITLALFGNIPSC